MPADSKHRIPEVSRRDAEAKLIECRNRFLGFLRKRLGSQHEAEDVFQDFCVKVLRSHASIKRGARLDAWLGITLRHTLTDHYRRRATRNRGTQAYSIEARILAPEPENTEEPACHCIGAALRKLEPAQAELLTRLDLQDEPRNAVAADLGVNLNALGVRLHRSRAALKKKIAEICPVCGEGGFMQCDCDHSRDRQPLLIPPETALAPRL
ncbi:sigma-70 family RNA polymerase sigma factor [Aliiroseovarius sp.]|uniref:RNA polymerase sigma factor n=1 Tax=Aliiroseovarius sp. TaxID=1872442 RepID=UPI0026352775|nr:sigma-70 family RNA polymerase sigma factor [Aliiroseovarius sp.]